MTIVRTQPGTSRPPLPVLLAMSNAQDAPVRPTSTTATAGSAMPSPLPPSYRAREEAAPPPPPSHPKNRIWPKPRLRLQCQNMGHAAAGVFFREFVSTELLDEVVDAVLTSLYVDPDDAAVQRPPVRSLTLVLRDMDGVAYTKGNDELGDNDHKEIHFSLGHIKNTVDGARTAAKKEAMARAQARTAGARTSDGGDSMEVEVADAMHAVQAEADMAASARAALEIRGVLVHEAVHAFQWNGSNSAPGGLIEGIADWVRLRQGLSPPHWNPQHKGDKWDAGYQTTAYFLDWCEKEAGEGKVRQCNAWLRAKRYNGDDMWKDVFGRAVADLWKEYTTKTY